MPFQKQDQQKRAQHHSQGDHDQIFKRDLPEEQPRNKSGKSRRQRHLQTLPGEQPRQGGG